MEDDEKNQNIRKAYACDDEDGDEGDKGFKEGPWTISEDAILVDYVQKNGEGNWTAVEKNSGLCRSGKSCLLRWKYHLRPDLNKCSFSEEEELRVAEPHADYGNKWARIATELPGRTDHDVKNFWRTKSLRIAGKPVYPSGIVLNHSTESGEFDMLDRHTSGSNHLDLLQEGNLEIPIPNPDIAQLQSHYSLSCPTSSLHEVPSLVSTRRNCPSDSYNSYPIVNTSEMNEIPPGDQHVNSPEVVAEPLVEPSPQSLLGVCPDTSSFCQPLSDVVPGSPDISNYSDFDYSNIFYEAPNLDLDACLSSHGTPAADHPLCLNQSSPAHSCQPVHPSPPGSIGHLEDIAYHEKLFPSQITGFCTSIVPTRDVNQSSYSPRGGNASFMSNDFSIHESLAEENQPFDEDAFVAGFLNDNEEPDDTDNSKPDDDVLNSI